MCVCLCVSKDFQCMFRGSAQDGNREGEEGNLPSEATVQLRAYPFTSTLSRELFPCAFKTLTDLMGYRTSPFWLVLFTAMAASTTIAEKKSASL